MNFSKIITTMVVSASLAIFTVGDSLAKDKKPKKGKGGDSVSTQIQDRPGKGSKNVPPGQVERYKHGSKTKTVPPGQIKRYTRGAKLPSDLRYTDISDLSKWNLKEPGKGNRYIRVDDEILEVSDDLSTVVDAVGIVGDLAK